MGNEIGPPGEMFTQVETINKRNRQEREERLAAAKAEERTGIAGAEDFEPLLPPPHEVDGLFATGALVPAHMYGVGEGDRANSDAAEHGELMKPWDPSMGRKRVTDEVLGLPHGLGRWQDTMHDTMLNKGWEYHETADAQVYRKPKRRPPLQG